MEKLKLLWDERMDYDQYPSYNCSKCEREIGSKIDKKREKERVHQFLMGLDGNLYGIVRSSLLATEPLPSLNRYIRHLFRKNESKIWLGLERIMVNSWHLQPSPLSSKRDEARIGRRVQYARIISDLHIRHMNVFNLWAILTGEATDPVTLG